MDIGINNFAVKVQKLKIFPCLIWGSMRERISGLFRDWRFHLIWITALAVIIRSIPAWIYSGWGNDFGIYYSITIEFLNRQNPLYEYPAVWGGSGYGSFPMFYLIILAAYSVTGADPRILVLRVPPIIGGLTVIPLFLIAYYLTKSHKISLLAALLLAINPIHVYQTSMPYFLTIGHFFFLFSLYFFMRWKDDKKWLYYLIPVSAMLIISHHLTTYMLIISMIGIWLVYSVFGKLPEKKIKTMFVYIFLFSFSAIGWWLLRVPGIYSFMSYPTHGFLPWFITPILYGILLLILIYIALNFRLTYRGKIKQYLEKVNISWCFSISLAVGILFFVLLAIFGLHGYYIPPMAIVYSIPFLLTIGFIGVGLFRLYKNEKLMLHITGWLGAITLSAIFGFFAWSLEPWRHVEYMMEALAIVGAMGILEVMESEIFKKVSVKKRIIITLEAPFYILTHSNNPELSGGIMQSLPVTNSKSVRDPVEYKFFYPFGKRMQILFTSIIIFMIVMTGITAFPFMGKVAPPQQQVSAVVMSGVEYLAEYGDKNYTVATSHKIGTLIAAYGFNSSFEYDYKIWNASSWQAALDELEGLNNTYPPIGYVIITKSMWENGVYGYKNLENPIGPPVYMTNESYLKFKKEPFEIIFENYTFNDWVEVYQVNWTYIQAHTNETIFTKNMERSYTLWNSHRDFLNFSISCSKEFNRSLFTSTPAIFIMNSRDFR